MGLPGWAVHTSIVRPGAAAICIESNMSSRRPTTGWWISLVPPVCSIATSTVGAILAGRLGVPFVDADSLHPPANVARMAAGIALTDADRTPWLGAVGRALATPPDGVVVACSALRRNYRDLLRAAAPDAVFVHLDGTRERLAERLTARLDHFMPAALLDSQLGTLEPLEPDEDGTVLSIDLPPATLAAAAAEAIHPLGVTPG